MWFFAVLDHCGEIFEAEKFLKYRKNKGERCGQQFNENKERKYERNNINSINHYNFVSL